MLAKNCKGEEQGWSAAAHGPARDPPPASLCGGRMSPKSPQGPPGREAAPCGARQRGSHEPMEHSVPCGLSTRLCPPPPGQGGFLNTPFPQGWRLPGVMQPGVRTHTRWLYSRRSLPASSSSSQSWWRPAQKEMAPSAPATSKRGPVPLKCPLSLPHPSLPSSYPPSGAWSPYPVLQRVRVDEVGQHVAEPEGEDVPEEPRDEAAARQEGP